jgi:hypothetical protein
MYLFGLAFGSLKRAFTLRNAIPPNFEMFGKRQKQFSATRFSPQTWVFQKLKILAFTAKKRDSHLSYMETYLYTLKLLLLRITQIQSYMDLSFPFVSLRSWNKYLQMEKGCVGHIYFSSSYVTHLPSPHWFHCCDAAATVLCSRLKMINKLLGSTLTQQWPIKLFILVFFSSCFYVVGVQRNGLFFPLKSYNYNTICILIKNL